MGWNRRWRVGVAVGGCVLVAGTAAAAYLIGTRRDVTTTSAEAYSFYRKGREDEQKLYFREAAAAYADALARDPDFAMAMVRLAVACQDRDPARSKSLLQCAARSRDSISDRERRLLDIFSKILVEKDRPGAEKLTDAYRRAYPDDPEGYLLQANQLMKKGNTKEAVELFTKVVTVNPNFAIAYNSLGYYWMGQRDFTKAEDNLKRYRFLAPDQANPYDSLGELYANTGRYEEADENLKKALAIKPDFYASLGHLGTVAVGRGDFAGAAAYFHQAAGLADDIQLATQFGLAEALSLYERGDQAGALAVLDALPAPPPEPKERAQVIRGLVSLVRSVVNGEPPPDPEVSRPEGVAKETYGDLAAATALVRWIREVRAGNLVGAKEFVAKDLPEFAIRTGEFSYYPTFPMLWLKLGEALGEAGATGEGAEIFKTLLAGNPRFQPVLNAQARLRGEKTAALAAPAVGHERP